MNNQNKQLLGSWIQAIGTVTSAIGSTPFQRLSSDFRNDLNLLGNVMQATGNALIADSITEDNLNKTGNQIQAIGNSTVVTSIVLDFKEITKQELNIKGNLMQALGGGAALGNGLETRTDSGLTSGIVGNYLQVIGNSMQAIGGRKQLNTTLNKKGYDYKLDGDALQINGSWVQAVGSVISALGVTKGS